MQNIGIISITSICIILNICQQLTLAGTTPCHDLERCICETGNPSRITCSDFSNLAANVFSNSKSNISDSFNIVGGSVSTPLSSKRFTSYAPLGYKEISLRDACVSEIEPLFFLYILHTHTNLLWRISITLSACLVHIQSKTFFQLPQLKVLDLSANSIRTIANEAFGMLPNLENLLLQQNRIATISDSTFRGLTRLHNIDLSSNELVSISGNAFSTLSRLDSLRLNGNRLKRLVPGTFSSLGLTTLNLSSNQLEEFSEDLVRGTTREALRNLYLSANQLTWLSEDVMDLDNSYSDLMELSLGRNPWMCNCAIGWMKSRTSFIVQSSIRCSQPPKLANKTLNTLTNASLCSWEINRYHGMTTLSREGGSDDDHTDEVIAIGASVLVVFLLIAICFALYRFRDRLSRRRGATPISDKHQNMLYSLGRNSEDEIIPFDEIHSNTDGCETGSTPLHCNNHIQLQHQGV